MIYSKMGTNNLTSNLPTVSIITVNYNNNIGLIKTLESIKKQSFTSYEHIIIDANSTDGSKETIMQYEKETKYLSQWISEPDNGIYDGMNKGILMAKGTYLYFLNSGDCLCDDILSKIPFNGTQFFYGDTRFYKNHTIQTYTYPDIPDFIYLSNNSFCHQSCFIHRSLFEQQMYDTKYKIISDWAHSFQCLIIARCSYQHLPFVISECDANGISSNKKVLRAEREKWFREQFPPILSNAFIDCTALDESKFREIIRLYSSTRKLKKRVKKMLLFLYSINSWFSKKQDNRKAKRL